MKPNERVPFGCITPHHLMSDKIHELLDAIFDRGMPVSEDELKDIHYYEEEQEVALDFLTIKKTAKVMRFSRMCGSFELNSGQSELISIAREYETVKIFMANSIANYIDERIVKFGELCEAILYSFPIKPQSGRLYKGNNVYFASKWERKHWDIECQIDLFLTPVIYTRDWKKWKEADGTQDEPAQLSKES